MPIMERDNKSSYTQSTQTVNLMVTIQVGGLAK